MADLASRRAGPTLCSCESPVIDVEHDAGCRRCGRPVNFSPALQPGDEVAFYGEPTVATVLAVLDDERIYVELIRNGARVTRHVDAVDRIVEREPCGCRVTSVGTAIPCRDHHA